MAQKLKLYGITEVVGDRYGGQWPREAFKKEGITYTPSQRTKAQIYVDFLPCLNSAQVELLDDHKCVNQFVGLERRTNSAGDRVDHVRGAHDDIANSVAGVLLNVANITPIEVYVATIPYDIVGEPEPTEKLLAIG